VARREKEAISAFLQADAVGPGVAYLYKRCTIRRMITNIDIDEELVAEAMQVSGARTKREVVDRALREMVARARRPRFIDFLGVGDIDPDYDPKDPGARGDEVGRFRVEQGRATYKVTRAAAPAPRKKPGRKP
jgi:hypothetical protein